MKKIIAIFMGLLMLFSITAYADVYDSLIPDFENGSVKISMNFECDDLTVFENMELDNDEFYGNDFTSMVSALHDAEFEYCVDYDFSDDYSSGKVAVISEVYVPLKMNENLEMTVRSKNGQWLSYDISDESNPKFEIILLNSGEDKYILFDVAEAWRQKGYDDKTVLAEIKKYANADYINQFTDGIKDLYRANSTVVTGKDGYTLTMSDAQIKAVYSEILPAVTGNVLMVMDGAFDDLGFDNTGLIADILNIFPDDAELSAEVYAKTDSDDVIKSAVSQANVSFNVSQKDGTTKRAKVKLSANYEYNGSDKNTVIAIPELTEDNTLMVYDENKYDDCYHLTVYCDYVPSAKETFYVSLSSILYELHNNLHPCSISRDGETVVISDSENTENFDTIKLTVGSVDFEVDGVSHTALNPVVSVDNLIYVDLAFLEKAFGYEIIWGNANIIDKKLYATFERQCPSPENEIGVNIDEFQNEEEMCWHYQDTCVPIDINYFNEGYFGLRSMVESHCISNGVEGLIDISYDNGIVTLKNMGSSEYFNEAVITVGSDIVIVDGVDYTVSLPATNRGGSVYIDKDTIKSIFKYELRGAHISCSNEWLDDPEQSGETVQQQVRVYREEAMFGRISPLCTHYATVPEYLDY
ncbi:MAG: hypothetical protein II998_03230 [Clostridia bacterium]|nr:hypothetical protein [Clostridia bacterium]